VLALEGGYDLDGLAQSAHACLEVLAGARRETFPTGAGRAAQTAVAQTLAALATRG
jgi:acetoin utilization deacetylase AcuC-like enzyme